MGSTKVSRSRAKSPAPSKASEGETEVVSNSEELCRSWDCDCNFFALVVAGSLGYLWYTNQTDYDFIATYDLGGCREMSTMFVLTMFIYEYLCGKNRMRWWFFEVPVWIAFYYYMDICNYVAFFASFVHLVWRFVRDTGADQPVEGAVFVTGCDSGMGETTAFHLAKTGYHVFACCYLKSSFEKYAHIPNVTPIEINVKDEKSVAAAAEFVTNELEERNITKGLVVFYSALVLLIPLLLNISLLKCSKIKSMLTFTVTFMSLKLSFPLSKNMQ